MPKKTIINHILLVKVNVTGLGDADAYRNILQVQQVMQDVLYEYKTIKQPKYKESEGLIRKVHRTFNGDIQYYPVYIGSTNITDSVEISVLNDLQPSDVENAIIRTFESYTNVAFDSLETHDETNDENKVEIKSEAFWKRVWKKILQRIEEFRERDSIFSDC